MLHVVACPQRYVLDILSDDIESVIESLTQSPDDDFEVFLLLAIATLVMRRSNAYAKARYSSVLFRKGETETLPV